MIQQTYLSTIVGIFNKFGTTTLAGLVRVCLQILFLFDKHWTNMDPSANFHWGQKKKENNVKTTSAGAKLTFEPSKNLIELENEREKHIVSSGETFHLDWFIVIHIMNNVTKYSLKNKIKRRKKEKV